MSQEQLSKFRSSLQNVTLQSGESIAFRSLVAGTPSASSPPLVLLHGFASSSIVFDKFATLIPRGTSLRVFAVDMPGFGHSSYKFRTNCLKDLAIGLIQFFDAMNFQAVHLAGWSTGGGVSLQIGAMIPKRVLSITLLNSVGITGMPLYRMNEKGKYTSVPVANHQEAQSHPLVQLFNRITGEQDTDMMSQFFKKAVYNVGGVPEPERVLDYCKEGCLERNAAEILWALNIFNLTSYNSGRAPGTGESQNITMPVLILSGDKDLLCPLSLQEETAREIAGSKLRIFKNVGHSVIESCPEDVWEAMLEMLSPKAKL